MESKKAQKKHTYEILESRIVVLGEITDENVNYAIKEILDIAKEDSKKPTAEPIELILNSPGGGVEYGFGLVDCIESCPTPVHVTVMGHAMSMALPILCVAAYRKMTKRSTLMYHEISWGVDREKLSWHKQEMAAGDRLQKMYDDVIIEYSKITKKKLEDVKSKHAEWYIDAEEALKLQLIDEIV